MSEVGEGGWREVRKGGGGFGREAAPTWMPETVKYGISNLTVIGGLSFLSSSLLTLGSPK